MNNFSKLFSKNESNQGVEKSNQFVLDKSIEVLATDLTNKVEWSTPKEYPKPVGDLFDSWYKIPGAHKWHHYFPIYEKIFSEYKSRPITILEIGVYKGASVQMWREYFHADTKIIGVDIDPNCKQFEDVNKNVFIRIGSQDDETFLKNVIQEFGEFDVIIDDGSHITSHMIASFNYLFLNGLKQTGLYFVEDTHSNYWPAYRNTKKSFVDMAKSLVDIMHYHYSMSRQEMDYRLGSDQQIKSFNVPKLTTLLDEIRFFDSIIVFYKKAQRILPVSEHL